MKTNRIEALQTNRALHRCRALLSLAAAATGLSLLPGTALAQGLDPNCTFGGRTLDYRSERERLSVVERRHFTTKVETLRGGESTSKPGGDLSYTLNWFPNHHRALLATVRLAKRLAVDKVPEMDYSVVCYFERALRFHPDDTVARMLFAQYLGDTGRTPEALAHLNQTAQYAGDNPLTHYNIGLLAMQLKAHDLALKHAHIAYASGQRAPALKELLRKEGKWVEPPASPHANPSAPAAAASAAASAPHS